MKGSRLHSLVRAAGLCSRFLRSVAAVGGGAAGVASGQVPVVSTWSGISAEWSIPGTWFHIPSGVPPFAPDPLTTPNNDGQFIYSVIVPSGTLNQSFTASVSNIEILTGATLEIAAGQLESLVIVNNTGELRVLAAGTLATPVLTNNLTTTLNTGGNLLVGDIENFETFDILGAGFITTGSFANRSGGAIDIGPGALVLNAAVLDNEGDINLFDVGSTLANPTGFNIVGSGDIDLRHPDATFTTASVISNGSGHLIHGEGLVAANGLSNSGTLFADTMFQTLEVDIGVGLDNPGTLRADQFAQLDVEAGSLDNGGLIHADNAGTVDIDLGGGGFDHDGQVHAINGGRVIVTDADITSSGSILSEANGTVTLIDTTHTGGTITADATTANALGATCRVTGTTVAGLLEGLPGANAEFAGTIDNTTGDLRVQAGARFWSSNATILGGTLSGGGVYDVESGQTNFDGVGQTWNDLTIDVNTRGRLRLTGAINNNALLRLVDTNSVIVDLQGHANALVRVDGPVELGGTGEIRFDTPWFNEFEIEPGSGSLLTLGPGQFVRTGGPTAEGRLTLDLVNAGRIDAEAGRITITNVSTTNTGVLAATAGGTLLVANDAMTLHNAGGLLSSGAGSTIDLHGTLVGGTIEGPGRVLVVSPTSFTGHVTTMPGADVAVGRFGTLRLVGDHHNNGLIRIADSNFGGLAGDDANLVIDGPVTLTGSGGVAFGNPNENYLQTTTEGGSLTIGPEQSLVALPGARGIIDGLPLTIEGRLESDGSIEVSGGTITNRGVIEARTPGVAIRLGSAPVRIDNTLGRIDTGAGSRVHLLDGTLTGGVFGGAGTLWTGSLARLVDLTTEPDTTILASGNSAVEMHGTFKNDGTIQMSGSGSHSFKALLRLDGPVVLDGSGQLTITSDQENFIDWLNGVGSTDSLRNGPTHTIHARPGARASFFRFPITNDGTVRSEGTIELTDMAVDNNGLMESFAPNGFKIGGLGPVVIENDGGILRSHPGGSIKLYTATVRGGTIDGGGQLTLTESNTRLEDVTIADGTTAYAGWASSVVAAGTITNHGTYAMAGTGTRSSKSQLRLDGPVTFAGNGTLEVRTEHENFLTPLNGAGDSLAIGPDQTFDILPGARCYMEGIGCTNAGTVRSSGLFQLSVPTLTNSGLITIPAGGNMQTGLNGPLMLDNTTGEIAIAPDGILQFLSGEVIGGRVTGGGIFRCGSSAAVSGGIEFEDTMIVLGGFNVLDVSDTLTTNSVIRLAAGSSSRFCRLRCDGRAILDGTGTLAAVNANQNYMARANNAPDDEFVLTESFGLEVQDGGWLYSDAPVTVPGKLVVNGRAFFVASQPALTTAPSTRISGTGTLVVTAPFENQGTIAPGNSTGALAFTLQVTHAPTATLEFEIGGTTQGVDYDYLGTGGQSLDGTLNVALVNGFMPGVGDTFDLIGGPLSGSFHTVHLPLLAPGLDWDTEDLETLGELQVVADPEAVSFSDWIAGQPGIPAGQDGPEDDPNNDGVANILAYYLGIDAMSDASLHLPRMRIANGSVLLEFTRSDLTTGVEAIIELSTDAVTWNPGPPIEPQSVDGLLQTTVAMLGPPVEDILLARLRVTATSP